MQGTSPGRNLFLTAQLIHIIGPAQTSPSPHNCLPSPLPFDTLLVDMGDSNLRQAARYRFGVFEADSATGELRKQGIRIKLNVQPFQVLLMLLERPGQVLSREEISRELWPHGPLVDSAHAVNSPVTPLRQPLGDKAGSPRFIETLARRGYRFLASVERIADNAASVSPALSYPAPELHHLPVRPPEPELVSRFLATPRDLPATPHHTVQTLFILLQIMYAAFYVGALSNLPEIGDLFASLPRPGEALTVLVVTAALLIPVRAFLLCAVLFHAPGVREKLLSIWPFLLPFDELWALSPFLLLHHINYGLALSCTALLAYSPFAQRALILMGAGAPAPQRVQA